MRSSTMPSVQDPNSISAIANQQALFNSQEFQFGGDVFQNFLGGIISNSSPVGMELGEFMVEGDVDFLNQLASI